MEGLIAIVCIQQPVLPEKAKKESNLHASDYIQEGYASEPKYIIIDQEIACIYYVLEPRPS